MMKESLAESNLSSVYNENRESVFSDFNDPENINDSALGENYNHNIYDSEQAQEQHRRLKAKHQ